MTLATKSRKPAKDASAPTSEPAAVPWVRVIREEAFAKRLAKACDANPSVPDMNLGRTTWIKRHLENRFSLKVSAETVSKWFAGENKPRPDKLMKLAQLLEVDVGWLSLGIDVAAKVRDQHVRNAMADGAVNLVAGLIQMDGGHVAFPDKPGLANLHAIIRGAKYDFHVATARVEGDQLSFTVPANTDSSLMVLGLVKRGLDIALFEVTPELLAEGEYRGAKLVIECKMSDPALTRLDDFKGRL